MKIENIYGWLGNLFLVLGMFFLSQKNVLGFYLSNIGELFYLFQADKLRITNIKALCYLLLVINTWGIIQWQQ